MCGLASPLDDVLAPLTRLTALHLLFDPTRDAPVPPPASLAQLTALRELEWEGLQRFRSEGASPHELASLLAPLTQLTALNVQNASIVLDASCSLPELPSLQCLNVCEVAQGGLVLLAASCPALVSLVTSWLTPDAGDAAARLPALTSLMVLDKCDLSWGPGAQLSLAGCAPALASLDVYSRSALDPTALTDRLTGLSQLHLRHAEGLPPLVMGTREWQALAALPALRCFSCCVELAEEGAGLAACVSFCAQLTDLRLTLGGSAPQLRGCVDFAAAMQASRVQLCCLSWQVAGDASCELPTPFYQHLASWRCLARLQLGPGGHACTAEQLGILCASPTLVHVVAEPTPRETAGALAQELMETHRGKELEVECWGAGPRIRGGVLHIPGFFLY